MRTNIPAEAARGCGHRKIGAMYLTVRMGIAFPCSLMPYPLELCPCCGSGVKFSRGIQWLSGDFFERAVAEKSCAPSCSFYPNDCPFADKVTQVATCPEDGPHLKIEPAPKKALMWVGESFYKTPEDFLREVKAMGISKRISTIPKDLILGETWVLLAHAKAASKQIPPEEEGMVATVKQIPGIFYAFRPTAIEKIYAEGTVTDEERERCAARGITPVEVPNIPKHRGTVYESVQENEQPGLFDV